MTDRAFLWLLDPLAPGAWPSDEAMKTPMNNSTPASVRRGPIVESLARSLRTAPVAHTKSGAPPTARKVGQQKITACMQKAKNNFEIFSDVHNNDEYMRRAALKAELHINAEEERRRANREQEDSEEEDDSDFEGGASNDDDDDDDNCSAEDEPSGEELYKSPEQKQKIAALREQLRKEKAADRRADKRGETLTEEDDDFSQDDDYEVDGEMFVNDDSIDETEGGSEGDSADEDEDDEDEDDEDEDDEQNEALAYMEKIRLVKAGRRATLLFEEEDRQRQHKKDTDVNIKISPEHSSRFVTMLEEHYGITDPVTLEEEAATVQRPMITLPREWQDGLRAVVGECVDSLAALARSGRERGRPLTLAEVNACADDLKGYVVFGSKRSRDAYDVPGKAVNGNFRSLYEKMQKLERANIPYVVAFFTTRLSDAETKRAWEAEKHSAACAACNTPISAYVETTNEIRDVALMVPGMEERAWETRWVCEHACRFLGALWAVRQGHHAMFSEIAHAALTGAPTDGAKNAWYEYYLLNAQICAKWHTSQPSKDRKEIGGWRDPSRAQ